MSEHMDEGNITIKSRRYVSLGDFLGGFSSITMILLFVLLLMCSISLVAIAVNRSQGAAEQRGSVPITVKTVSASELLDRMANINRDLNGFLAKKDDGYRYDPRGKPDPFDQKRVIKNMVRRKWVVKD